jgi:hypothetical protein
VAQLRPCKKALWDRHLDQYDSLSSFLERKKFKEENYCLRLHLLAESPSEEKYKKKE